MFYIGVWGWISFSGATEITSIASAIHVIEETVVTWLWGGFFVDNATNMWIVPSIILGKIYGIHSFNLQIF